MFKGRRQPFAGAFAGFILGFFGGLFLCPLPGEYGYSVQGVWTTTLSVAVVSSLIGVLLGIFANRPLTGRGKHLVVGILAGIIMGLIAGVVATDQAFNNAVKVSGLERGDPFFGKMTGTTRGRFRDFGLVFGPLVGALAGAASGFSFGVARHRAVTAVLLLTVVALVGGTIWSASIERLQKRFLESFEMGCRERHPTKHVAAASDFHTYISTVAIKRATDLPSGWD